MNERTTPDPISSDELIAAQQAVGRTLEKDFHGCSYQRADWIDERLMALAANLAKVQVNMVRLSELEEAHDALADAVTALNVQVGELDGAVASLANQVKVPSDDGEHVRQSPKPVRLLLHYVERPSRPAQPPWLLTEGLASTRRRFLDKAKVDGELVVDELRCTFVGDKLEVAWPDKRVELLDVRDVLGGRTVDAAIRSWSTYSWRTAEELQAASAFLVAEASA